MAVLPVLFRHRSTLVLPLVFPLLVWTFGSGPPRLWEALSGLGVVLAGGILRLASARCLGRGARVHRADARGGLVSWGPYAWSRNPLYLAAALVLTGLGIAAGGEGWAGLMLLGTFLVYTPVVIHEAAAIRESVGPDYDAYVRAVPRWIGIPRWSRLPPREPGADERQPWGQVLRRELGLLPGLGAGVVAIVGARAGWLPLKALLVPLVDASGLPLEAICGLGLGLGALGNSVGIERKRRRHEARREQQAQERAAAEGASARPEAELAEQPAPESGGATAGD